MQLYSWYISWASSAFWDSSHAALCSQRCCCLPTINWATTGLVFTSQDDGICSAYLFNRRRTAPPGAHSQQHTREGQLAGQVYGYYLVLGKRSKQSLGLTPDSTLSSTTLSAGQSARAPTCLALPCCFLPACKYANFYTALAPLGKAAYLLPCLLRISSGAG